PRFTMTLHGDFLFVRIGSPITEQPAERDTPTVVNSLRCLNLKETGKQKWEYPTPNRPDELETYIKERWAFEGPPVCDGERVYAAMRRSTFRSEEHVAAFDAHDGRLLWRRKICSADSPAHGMHRLTTHNLLTLNEGTIYCNTNLGTV